MNPGHQARRTVSIICPVYNEHKTVLLFYERLRAVFDSPSPTYELQILFIDNRSTDDTREIIQHLHEQDPRIELLTLSRNFGYQASVLSGLNYARGDAIIVIDVDCEDPPEMIPQFLTESENGFDIVYGIRDKRMEFIGVQLIRKLFYRLLRLTADSHIILDMAEFALIASHVRDQVIRNSTSFPFIRTEIGYVGFERKGIAYQRQKRIAGKTHYNFVTMTAFAVGGILSSSTYLLRLAAFVALVLFPTNLVLLLLDIFGVWGFAFHVLVAFDLMYLVGLLATISLYIARIYKNALARPIFIVDWAKSIYPADPVMRAGRQVSDLSDRSI